MDNDHDEMMLRRNFKKGGNNKDQKSTCKLIIDHLPITNYVPWAQFLPKSSHLSATCDLAELTRRMTTFGPNYYILFCASLLCFLLAINVTQFILVGTFLCLLTILWSLSISTFPNMPCIVRFTQIGILISTVVLTTYVTHQYIAVWLALAVAILITFHVVLFKPNTFKPLNEDISSTAPPAAPPAAPTTIHSSTSETPPEISVKTLN